MMMEEEIAWLIDQLGLSYVDAYTMPFSRRRRLLGWKSEHLIQQQAKEKAEAQRVSSRARRRR